MQYDRQAFATAPDGTRLFYGIRGPRPADPLRAEASGTGGAAAVNPALQPLDAALQPLDAALQPVDPALRPLDPSLRPSDPALRPLDPALQPLDPSLRPSDPALRPLDPALRPLDPALRPLDPALQPLTFVLTDGIGCDGFVWKYLQPYLAERYRVVHWHYRAHGRSALPADPARVDIAAHARDLLAVMDAAGIERAILAGHSMGTQVSLEAYRLAPDRVLGLALLCGSYGKITTTFHGSDVLKQVLPSVIDLVEKNQGLARALWGRIPPGLAFRFAQLSREVDSLAIREEDFRWYMEHVATMEPGIFLAMLRLAGEHTAEDVLEHIQVPALVLAAERDTFTPFALAEHMAKVIPGADFYLLRGASHAAPVEQPVTVERRIDRWLTERFAEPTTHARAAERERARDTG